MLGWDTSWVQKTEENFSLPGKDEGVEGVDITAATRGKND